MAHPTFQSAFSRIFDVAIFGTGYAAFGAALHVRQKGKSVCLVSRQSDLLWESGRAFMPCAGASDNPLWREWMAELESRNATAEGDIDGALAEITGTEIIAQKGIDALYYSTPVGTETSGDALEAIIVATKSGHRRLIARQWIDATETGEVIGLLRPDLQLRAPETRHLFAYYQSVHWPGRNPHEISAGEAHITWSPALWPRQRRVAIALPGHTEHPRAHIIPALRELFQALGDRIKDAAMSHCSLLDCPEYAHGNAPSFSLPKNVLSAAPALSGQAIATLADRFTLGVNAVREAATHDPPADIRTRPIRVPIRRQDKTDVFVAGAGTGGAYAAIAAARAGAKIAAVEPCEFPGGIGAGGGIHWYYFGVPGGLQAEADQRTLDVMPLFGGQTHIRGFHPEARKLILEEMFDEAGVDFRKGAMVCAAHKTGRTVTRVTIATAQGLIDISARAFIDATGDGDLCVQAGAEFTFGRQGDGLVHAYSQSGGRIGERNGVLTVEHMNFDAGFTDPTDAEDLTRARLSGIRHYLQDRFDDASRWTYIAPAIGLRQSRQIKTDYVVSLADLIERRKFPDAIGYTGAHYDNHAVDYEFESDEGLFWVWLCRQWREGRTACEIPYRMMLPKDLDNVWIACRAAGVSQDAHHSLRMQRDIQRLGEAAGNAAAISAHRACGAREVPFVELRDRLAQTGALDLEKSNLTLDFGPTDGINTLKELRDEAEISDDQIAEGLKDLQAGKPSRAIWYLYRAKDRVQADVFNALGSDNLMTSWLASGILALWGDERAERRLLNAIRTEEYGYEDEDDAKKPEKNNRVVPNWLAAISFLRCCGTRQTLPVFQDFAAQTSLSLNVRTGMALTLERLIDRGVLDESDKKTAARLVEMLLSGKMPGTVEIPQRNLAATMNADGPLKRGGPGGKTQDDYRWQIVLVLSRISKKLGLPVPEEAKTFKRDSRALVRRAFADI